MVMEARSTSFTLDMNCDIVATSTTWPRSYHQPIGGSTIRQPAQASTAPFKSSPHQSPIPVIPGVVMQSTVHPEPPSTQSTNTSDDSPPSSQESSEDGHNLLRCNILPDPRSRMGEGQQLTLDKRTVPKGDGEENKSVDDDEDVDIMIVESRTIVKTRKVVISDEVIDLSSESDEEDAGVSEGTTGGSGQEVGGVIHKEEGGAGQQVDRVSHNEGGWAVQHTGGVQTELGGARQEVGEDRQEGRTVGLIDPQADAPSASSNGESSFISVCSDIVSIVPLSASIPSPVIVNEPTHTEVISSDDSDQDKEAVEEENNSVNPIFIFKKKLDLNTLHDVVTVSKGDENEELDVDDDDDDCDTNINMQEAIQGKEKNKGLEQDSEDLGESTSSPTLMACTLTDQSCVSDVDSESNNISTNPHQKPTQSGHIRLYDGSESDPEEEEEKEEEEEDHQEDEEDHQEEEEEEDHQEEEDHHEDDIDVGGDMNGERDDEELDITGDLNVDVLSADEGLTEAEKLVLQVRFDLQYDELYGRYS